MLLTESTQPWVANALSVLRNDVFNLPARMQQVVMTSAPPPRQVSEFVEAVDTLYAKLTATLKVDLPLNDVEAGLLRTALAAHRRQLAESVYRSTAAVSDPEYAAALEGLLDEVDELLSGPELREQAPIPRPRLPAFLNRSGVERVVPAFGFGKREYDAKHQALLSVSLLQADLNGLRRECDERQRPLAVVFADLDDFRAFNSALGETTVDRVVLPQILRAIADVTFGHGYAYRHGGDEVVLLLPNASADLAGALVAEVRGTLAGLHFPGTELRARVSAGAWISIPESHLAGAEIVDRASKAKKAAKARGKGITVIHHEWGSSHEELILS